MGILEHSHPADNQGRQPGQTAQNKKTGNEIATGSWKIHVSSTL
jgi:hypothetical protein